MRFVQPRTSAWVDGAGRHGSCLFSCQCPRPTGVSELRERERVRPLAGSAALPVSYHSAHIVQRTSELRRVVAVAAAGPTRPAAAAAAAVYI